MINMINIMMMSKNINFIQHHRHAMRTENSVHEQIVAVTFCVFSALECFLFYFIKQTLLN